MFCFCWMAQYFLLCWKSITFVYKINYVLLFCYLCTQKQFFNVPHTEQNRSMCPSPGVAQQDPQLRPVYSAPQSPGTCSCPPGWRSPLPSWHPRTHAHYNARHFRKSWISQHYLHLHLILSSMKLDDESSCMLAWLWWCVMKVNMFCSFSIKDKSIDLRTSIKTRLPLIQWSRLGCFFILVRLWCSDIYYSAFLHSHWEVIATSSSQHVMSKTF